MDVAVDAADRAAVAAQLGRPPRGLRAVAHRCPCGLPDVAETAPRLEDGSPFPTLYYLTCPRAAAAVARLESGGVMRAMNRRLATDAELAAAYARAHRDYLSRRDALGVLPGSPSAGGMPTRVKCLHVLVAHSLAAGPGVNSLGDEALAELPPWWEAGRCVDGDVVDHVDRDVVADVDGDVVADVDGDVVDVDAVRGQDRPPGEP